MRFWPRVPDVGYPGVLQPQLEAWTDNSHLADVLAEDLGLYTGWGPVTREAAMRVPAMARARNLTCGTLAALPLVAYRADAPVAPQPYWAYGTDGQLGDLSPAQCRKWGITPQSPYHRALWTADDLLFYEASLWLVTSRLATGAPARMVRVPWDSWTVDDTGAIVDADNDPYPAEDVVWIPGPTAGLLVHGASSLRMAYDLERNARDVAVRPLRLEAHQTSAAELTAAERAEIVAEIRKAMADNDGILFTNNALELIEHRVDADALQLGARNASALDVARHANMPALMLDATAAGASLEYQTATGRNQEWLDHGLSLYVDAINARLSMDDVVPAGQRIAHDVSQWTTTTPTPTGYPAAD